MTREKYQIKLNKTLISGIVETHSANIYSGDWEIEIFHKPSVNVDPLMASRGHVIKIHLLLDIHTKCFRHISVCSDCVTSPVPQASPKSEAAADWLCDRLNDEVTDMKVTDSWTDWHQAEWPTNALCGRVLTCLCIHISTSATAGSL